MASLRGFIDQCSAGHPSISRDSEQTTGSGKIFSLRLSLIGNAESRKTGVPSKGLGSTLSLDTINDRDGSRDHLYPLSRKRKAGEIAARIRLKTVLRGTETGTSAP
jgi:hypothetical protein